ncbi:hypothetical protein [Candidatus Vondammii sp. HM_W22]|uniref:hypothetical protein n=1 Tax=Candidatus Vondammii sp. HM_W22 TaxID=2687299 RepID=UPI001F143A59|nr:hypothetical protein [Candidatus Vondammii sp. HM_W22]
MKITSAAAVDGEPGNNRWSKIECVLEQDVPKRTTSIEDALVMLIGYRLMH